MNRVLRIDLGQVSQHTDGLQLLLGDDFKKASKGLQGVTFQPGPDSRKPENAKVRQLIEEAHQLGRAIVNARNSSEAQSIRDQLNALLASPHAAGEAGKNLQIVVAMNLKKCDDISAILSITEAGRSNMGNPLNKGPFKPTASEGFLNQVYSGVTKETKALLDVINPELNYAVGRGPDGKYNYMSGKGLRETLASQDIFARYGTLADDAPEKRAFNLRHFKNEKGYAAATPAERASAKKSIREEAENARGFKVLNVAVSKDGAMLPPGAVEKERARAGAAADEQFDAIFEGKSVSAPASKADEKKSFAALSTAAVTADTYSVQNVDDLTALNATTPTGLPDISKTTRGGAVKKPAILAAPATR